MSTAMMSTEIDSRTFVVDASRERVWRLIGKVIFSSLPGTFMAFHWHGDTFKIPRGAARIAQSEGCENQAFEFGRAIGLQFHLEYSKKSIDLMFRNCSDELVDGKYIQTPDEIISKIANVHEMNKTLNLILDNMEREFGTPH